MFKQIFDQTQPTRLYPHHNMRLMALLFTAISQMLKMEVFKHADKSEESHRKDKASLAQTINEMITLYATVAKSSYKTYESLQNNFGSFDKVFARGVTIDEIERVIKSFNGEEISNIHFLSKYIRLVYLASFNYLEPIEDDDITKDEELIETDILVEPNELIEPNEDETTEEDKELIEPNEDEELIEPNEDEDITEEELKEIKDDFTKFKGIGQSTQDYIYSLGIYTYEDFKVAFAKDKLSTLINEGEEKIYKQKFPVLEKLYQQLTQP